MMILYTTIIEDKLAHDAKGDYFIMKEWIRDLVVGLADIDE